MSMMIGAVLLFFGGYIALVSFGLYRPFPSNADYEKWQVSFGGALRWLGPVLGVIGLAILLRSSLFPSPFPRDLSAPGVPPSVIQTEDDAQGGPRRLRMVCPVCGEWKEHDRKAFIMAFVEGMPSDSPEAQEMLKNRQAVMPFIEKHLTHCRKHGGGIKFIEEGEVAFGRLDPKKEEK